MLGSINALAFFFAIGFFALLVFTLIKKEKSYITTLAVCTVACLVLAIFTRIEHFKLGNFEVQIWAPNDVKFTSKIFPIPEQGDLKVYLVPKEYQAERNSDGTYTATVQEGRTYDMLVLTYAPDGKQPPKLAFEKPVAVPTPEPEFVRLPQTTSVRGSIIDLAKQPLGGLTVRLGDAYLDATDQSGRFQIDDVPAGHYRVRATCANQESLAEDITINPEQPPPALRLVFPKPVVLARFCEHLRRGEKQGAAYPGTWDCQINEELDFAKVFPPRRRIYFYTRIISGGPAKIYHAWYWKDQTGIWQLQSDRIPLSVDRNTRGYRTYSEKYLDRSGRWKVEVTSDEGTLLHTESFSVAS